MLLSGKTAVISGRLSRRGIGLATARLFAGRGRARSPSSIIDERRGPGRPPTEIGVRASRPSAATSSTVPPATRRQARVLDRLRPGSTCSVNNAGITQPLKIMEIGAGRSGSAVTDVNLRGVL